MLAVGGGERTAQTSPGGADRTVIGQEGKQDGPRGGRNYVFPGSRGEKEGPIPQARKIRGSMVGGQGEKEKTEGVEKAEEPTARSREWSPKNRGTKKKFGENSVTVLKRERTTVPWNATRKEGDKTLTGF